MTAWIPGSSAPIWLQEAGRFSRFVDLGLCKYPDARQNVRQRFQAPRPLNALYHPFLISLLNMLGKESRHMDQDTFEARYFSCVEKWLSEDEDFARLLGGMELAHSD